MTDLRAQATVMAEMVREFGPLFIKMAQVAAANSGFLPDEMSEALAVFQEDVEPMSEAEETANEPTVDTEAIADAAVPAVAEASAVATVPSSAESRCSGFAPPPPAPSGIPTM